MLLKQIHCQNLLSFGPDSKPLELRPLNILIGPNGSGKSNLIDAISILQAVPGDIEVPFREGGGISEWSWKHSSSSKNAELAVIIDATAFLPAILKHEMTFNCDHYGEGLSLEVIQDLENDETPTRFAHHDGKVVFKSETPLSQGIDLTHLRGNISIVGQITHLSVFRDLRDSYERIVIFRQWSFGRNAPLRKPQRADEPARHLAEDFSNMAVVLGRILYQPTVKQNLLNRLSSFSQGISDIIVYPISGWLEVVFHIDGCAIPASRVSDGTLRFLALLTILCDPEPPGLICLEEPELGMHPDVIPTIADLLKEASQRTQLIVTTHSPMLVDCFNSTPEDIVVCEKHDGQTQMNRLDPEELKHWLESFSLGKLWSQGNIGGNRW